MTHHGDSLVSNTRFWYLLIRNSEPLAVQDKVEVEFLLSSRSTNRAETIREVSRTVAASYNNDLTRVAPGQHPKMHNAIDEAHLGPQFAEWSLDSDSTIEMPNRGGAPCEYLLNTCFSSLWVI
jgi:hypothetical protein